MDLPRPDSSDRSQESRLVGAPPTLGGNIRTNASPKCWQQICHHWKRIALKVGRFASLKSVISTIVFLDECLSICRPLWRAHLHTPYSIRTHSHGSRENGIIMPAVAAVYIFHFDFIGGLLRALISRTSLKYKYIYCIYLSMCHVVYTQRFLPRMVASFV